MYHPNGLGLFRFKRPAMYSEFRNDAVKIPQIQHRTYKLHALYVSATYANAIPIIYETGNRLFGHII